MDEQFNSWRTYQDGDSDILSDNAVSPWFDGQEQSLLRRTPRGGVRFGLVRESDNVIVKNVLTVKGEMGCGYSGPSASWKPVILSPFGGSAVTSLATGLYRASYAVFTLDYYGISSVGNTESLPVNIVNATSKPRVDFGSPPPPYSYYVLYLTDLDAEAGSGRVYCSGITGATVDLVSDKWHNEYVGGVAVGGTVPVVSASHPPDILTVCALTVDAVNGGRVIINNDANLKIRGDVYIKSNTSIADPIVTVKGSGQWGYATDMCRNPLLTEYREIRQGIFRVLYTS